MLACRNHPDVVEGVRYCSRCGGQFCRDCIVPMGDRIFCGTCKFEQLRDMQSGFDRMRLNYAPFGKRFGALIIDRIIILLPTYGIFIAAMFIFTDSKGEPSGWVLLLLIPLVFGMPVYEALMTIYKNGQTLGKQALRLRVVRVDGTPVTTGQAWGRAVMRFVFEGCISIIDYLPALFTEEKTTLHDMTAGTRVIELY